MSDLLNQQQSYAQPTEINTRYAASQQKWNDRIGSAAKSARNWRVIALILGLSLILAIVSNIYLVATKEVKTIVVRINDDGAPTSTRFIGNETYAPKEKEIRYLLSRIVINTRSLPQDVVLISQNWNEGYDFMTDNAKRQMADIALADGLPDKVQAIKLNERSKVSVSIRIKSFLPISQDTFLLRWIESTYNSEGIKTDQSTYSGRFTIELREPANETEAIKNPLGIYIVDLAINKEFD